VPASARTVSMFCGATRVAVSTARCSHVARRAAAAQAQQPRARFVGAAAMKDEGRRASLLSCSQVQGARNPSAQPLRRRHGRHRLRAGFPP
jgi:hypothetical protein